MFIIFLYGMANSHKATIAFSPILNSQFAGFDF